TIRVEFHEEQASDNQLLENLDLLEERRADAHLGALTYKKAIVKLHNHKVKLAPNWEGPYRVISTIQEGTYILAIMEKKLLQRTWHISNLRKIYVYPITKG
ncbi:hypothetical protein BHE74_00032369, partial [Ensete ventricosum]